MCRQIRTEDFKHLLEVSFSMQKLKSSAASSMLLDVRPLTELVLKVLFRCVCLDRDQITII